MNGQTPPVQPKRMPAPIDFAKFYLTCAAIGGGLGLVWYLSSGPSYVRGKRA